MTPNESASQSHSFDDPHEPLNEESPLLSPASHDDGEPSPNGLDGIERNKADEFQSTKSLSYLILLTIGIGGLQIAWSVELSNGGV